MNIITTFTTALFCGSGEASIPLFTNRLTWLDAQLSELITKVNRELNSWQFSAFRPALNVVYSGNPCDA